jgi:hypothetical protein
MEKRMQSTTVPHLDKLLEYSLDDLHIIATAELDGCGAELLDELYGAMVEEYVMWLRVLRERTS